MLQYEKILIWGTDMPLSMIYLAAVPVSFFNQIIWGNRILNWLIALAILAAAFLLRRLLAHLCQTLLQHIHWKNEALGSQIATLLLPALRLTILTIGFGLAIRPELLTLPDSVSLVLRQVMTTLQVVILCLILQGIGLGFVDVRADYAQRQGQQQSLAIKGFYKRVIQVAAVILGVFMALKIWGFDISGLLAGLGIGGLALSLAAQDTFSNLLGGITIMADHSFEIGDVISTPDIEGVVEDIGFRSSKLRTFSQAVVTVPNAKLSSTFVTNFSRMGKRRIRLTINLEYGITTEQIRHLTDQLKTRVIARDSIYVDGMLIYLEKFNASSVDLLFQCYVKTVDYECYLAEQESILLDIMDVMAEEHLNFAFSALSVHLRQPAPEKAAGDEPKTAALRATESAADDENNQSKLHIQAALNQADTATKQNTL
ncbi:MAG: mechanosensitive ion channel family protein [Clostridiaceae bacterium]|nr:mechanosensitive ion channel family protein [Clostridiaceae bacterium]